MHYSDGVLFSSKSVLLLGFFYRLSLISVKKYRTKENDFLHKQSLCAPNRGLVKLGRTKDNFYPVGFRVRNKTNL